MVIPKPPNIEDATYAIVALDDKDQLWHSVVFYGEEPPSVYMRESIKQELIDEAEEFGLEGVDYTLYLVDKKNPAWKSLMAIWTQQKHTHHGE